MIFMMNDTVELAVADVVTSRLLLHDKWVKLKKTQYKFLVTVNQTKIACPSNHFYLQGYCVWGGIDSGAAVIKSAAAKRSLPRRDLEVVIKPAASAASPMTRMQGSPRMYHSSADGGRGQGAPLHFGHRGLGGCACRRLDHGFQVPPEEAALAADLFRATPKKAKKH